MRTSAVAHRAGKTRHPVFLFAHLSGQRLLETSLLPLAHSLSVPPLAILLSGQRRDGASLHRSQVEESLAALT